MRQKQKRPDLQTILCNSTLFMATWSCYVITNFIRRDAIYMYQIATYTYIQYRLVVYSSRRPITCNNHDIGFGNFLHLGYYKVSMV